MQKELLLQSNPVQTRPVGEGSTRSCQCGAILVWIYPDDAEAAHKEFSREIQQDFIRFIDKGPLVEDKVNGMLNFELCAAQHTPASIIPEPDLCNEGTVAAAT